MMVRFLWILLLMPAVDIFLSIALFQRYGMPFLALLLAAAVLGSLLIGRAKAGVRAALASAASGGNPQMLGGSLLGLLASARSFFAGLLLIFPGVITDLLALVVLLLPARMAGARIMPKAANDDVIDAEFHEVRDDQRLPPDRQDPGTPGRR
jgi:UPF0716 protein FxsA